jgi:hypothetical protein
VQGLSDSEVLEIFTPGRKARIAAAVKASGAIPGSDAAAAAAASASRAAADSDPRRLPTPLEILQRISTLAQSPARELLALGVRTAYLRGADDPLLLRRELEILSRSFSSQDTADPSPNASTAAAAEQEQEQQALKEQALRAKYAFDEVFHDLTALTPSLKAQAVVMDYVPMMSPAATHCFAVEHANKQVQSRSTAATASSAGVGNADVNESLSGDVKRGLFRLGPGSSSTNRSILGLHDSDSSDDEVETAALDRAARRLGLDGVRSLSRRRASALDLFSGPGRGLQEYNLFDLTGDAAEWRGGGDGDDEEGDEEDAEGDFSRRDRALARCVQVLFDYKGQSWRAESAQLALSDGRASATLANGAGHVTAGPLEGPSGAVNNPFWAAALARGGPLLSITQQEEKAKQRALRVQLATQVQDFWLGVFGDRSKDNVVTTVILDAFSYLSEGRLSRELPAEQANAYAVRYFYLSISLSLYLSISLSTHTRIRVCVPLLLFFLSFLLIEEICVSAPTRSSTNIS